MTLEACYRKQVCPGNITQADGFGNRGSLCWGWSEPMGTQPTAPRAVHWSPALQIGVSGIKHQKKTQSSKSTPTFFYLLTHYPTLLEKFATGVSSLQRIRQSSVIRELITLNQDFSLKRWVVFKMTLYLLGLSFLISKINGLRINCF